MTQTLLAEDKTPPADDCWNLAHAQAHGEPVLIRYRSRRPRGVQASAYPYLLSIRWTYKSDPAGLPSPETLEAMTRFEDALQPALENSQSAYLMVIITGRGERDWLWYARGEKEVFDGVNQTLNGRERFPVRFAIQEDRGWAAYAQFEDAGRAPRGGRIASLFSGLFARVARLLGLRATSAAG